MKNSLIRYTILSLLVMVMPVVSYGRQTTYNRLEHHDFIYLSPAIGYQSMLDTTKSDALASQMTMGGAIEFGAGYRMYHNHFLLQVGLNLKYGANRVEGNPLTVSLPEVVELTNHYDVIHAGEVQAPIQVGAEYRRFYFLIGPKIGLGVYSSSKPFADAMKGNEAFPVVQNKSRDAFKYLYNLNAAVEVSWRLGEVFYEHGADVPHPSTRYYLGLFAEGGALSRTVPEGRTTFYEATTKDVDGETKIAVGLSPICGLNDFKNTQFIHNYTVGIKLTVLFELENSMYCALCKEHKKVNFSW